MAKCTAVDIPAF